MLCGLQGNWKSRQNKNWLATWEGCEEIAGKQRQEALDEERLLEEEERVRL